MHKIAVIEDAKDNRDFLYYLLRDDYSVLRYGTGEEVLQALPREMVDLIIMDIWLPDMDGVDLLNRIRQEERLRNVPVIALTANAMLGDREKYLAAGFDKYVSKPIGDIDEFLATIRRCVDASRSRG
jgi:two-component system cell cycle response regulator DivK